MYQAEYPGINAFLKESCKLLLSEAVPRQVRGTTCWEISEPYIFKIIDPTSRLVSIPERNWYAPLAYAESLWLASGRNDMDFINIYGRRLHTYSDNGETMRGGYGPRLRHYNGDMVDYDFKNVCDETSLEVDQFRYVIDCFERDLNTRQAIINIGDPIKDCFGYDRKIKETKDIPCTRMLHFMKDARSNKLNLIVSMRSNDLIWGASGVNIFNFTFMQEYFAAMLGLEIGSYYHVVNNMHFYDDLRPMVEEIANADYVENEHFEYKKSFKSLTSFDSLIKTLLEEESKMRKEGELYKYYHFEDDFFHDWYNVLYHRLTRRKIDFINPMLNRLINKSKIYKV